MRINGRGFALTEAAGGGRAEIEGRIIQRSLEDEDFRRRLLEDPKVAVEEELGARLPEGVEVRAVEETVETIYLVLPSGSPVEESSELSDQDLQEVAGGQVPTWGPTYDKACGY
jgi:hypothetical protein